MALRPPSHTPSLPCPRLPLFTPPQGNNFVDIWAEKEKVIFLDKLKEVFESIHGAENGG